jgi:hypothetical protein
MKLRRGKTALLNRDLVTSTGNIKSSKDVVATDPRIQVISRDRKGAWERQEGCMVGDPHP